MNITNKFSFIFLFIIITLIFSCNKNLEDNTPTLRVALNGEPTTLDPQQTSATLTAQITRNIYNTLLNAENLSPELASSWSVSDDGKMWSFNLRENITFHHGKKFDSEDVVASFARLIDQDISHTTLDSIKSVEAQGPYKVNIALKNIDPSMPNLLGSNEFQIMPSDLIEAEHNFSRNPVGTGAFKFVEWEDGIKITLERSSYFNEIINPKSDVANVGALEFFILPDISSKISALKRGEIDVIPYISDPELSSLEKDKQVRIKEFPISTILVIAMNTRKAPFDNRKFRNAIAMSINKQQVIDIAYPRSVLNNSFWPKGTPYSVDIPSKYNPEKARNYFASLSAEDRQIVIKVPQNFEVHVRAAEVYQQQLSAVGLNIRVEKISWNSWLEDVYKKADFDMTVIAHTGKTSPYQRLNAMIKDNYYIGWKNEKFISLMNSLPKIRDAQEYNLVYQDIFREITEAAPFIFIGQAVVNVAISKDVEGIKFTPMERYDFTKARIKR